MIEFGSDLAKLNEKLEVFSESVFELLEKCVKTECHTTTRAHEITEVHQKIMSIDERMMEMNDRMNKLEQGCNNPISQSTV